MRRGRLAACLAGLLILISACGSDVMRCQMTGADGGMAATLTCTATGVSARGSRLEPRVTRVADLSALNPGDFVAASLRLTSRGEFARVQFYGADDRLYSLQTESAVELTNEMIRVVDNHVEFIIVGSDAIRLDVTFRLPG